MYGLMAQLFPICRSITGNGVRETLRKLQEKIQLKVSEVPTGTQVFDWTIPKEWNIRDAYVKDSSGNRVIDFQKSNLHVVSYSIPIRAKMSLADLKSHLFTLPDQPDRIPYRTSYYKESWGFCLTHADLTALKESEYEVCIESTLHDGALTFAECYLPGESSDEILISCHICHPSLCNDNLSGIALATFLAQFLGSASKRYSYRFLFIPGTIGAIAWLALNEARLGRIKHGLVLTGVGDSGQLHYKKTRTGIAEIDQAALQVLKHSNESYQILDFSPYGYDERQFGSPGINLPVGRLSRTPHGTFPEYHTSADNMNFVHPDQLGKALQVCLKIFSILEDNRKFVNLVPKCEPQLGRRGLYRMIGGQNDAGMSEMAMLWVLNQSDGETSLLDIAKRSGLNFSTVCKAARILEQNQLLREAAKSVSQAAH
jgi:aminopeptidase-like protein